MKNKKTKDQLKNELRICMILLAILVFVFIVLLGMVVHRLWPRDKRQSIETVKQTMETSAKEETYTGSLEETLKETIKETIEETEMDPLLMLVNKDHKIPSDYEYELKELPEGHFIDQRAYNDYQRMMADGEKQGLNIVLCSSWRDVEVQKRLFSEQVDLYMEEGYSESDAYDSASEWLAIPGTSEHEIGLAVDLVSESYQSLNEAQEQTAEQQWLMAHCAEYGFILRYPKGKEFITGIHYEPWHYRYVGVLAAKEITEKGICLEEYHQEAIR